MVLLVRVILNILQLLGALNVSEIQDQFYILHHNVIGERLLKRILRDRERFHHDEQLDRYSAIEGASIPTWDEVILNVLAREDARGGLTAEEIISKISWHLKCGQLYLKDSIQEALVRLEGFGLFNKIGYSRYQLKRNQYVLEEAGYDFYLFNLARKISHGYVRDRILHNITGTEFLNIIDIGTLPDYYLRTIDPYDKIHEFYQQLGQYYTIFYDHSPLGNDIGNILTAVPLGVNAVKIAFLQANQGDPTTTDDAYLLSGHSILIEGKAICTIVYVNCHRLSPIGKMLMFHRLREYIENIDIEYALPHIVQGDFNAVSATKSLWEDFKNDMTLVYGYTKMRAYRFYNRRNRRRRTRVPLDYVFIRDFKDSSISVNTDIFQPTEYFHAPYKHTHYF